MIIILLFLIALVAVLLGAFFGIRALVRLASARREDTSRVREVGPRDEEGESDVERALDQALTAGGVSARHRRTLLRRAVRDARRQRRTEEREARLRERDAYLDSLRMPSLYQLVLIFTVASIGGLVLETIWVQFAMGIWQRRYGLVWGPFSPLYGFGAVLLTLTLWKLRTRPMWVVFLASMVLGSALEQATGMILEVAMNSTAWSYEHYPDAITKYVSLRMSMIWGLLGWVWCKLLMPEIIFYIGEPRRRVELVLVAVLTAFLVLDGLTTVAVIMRKNARDQGVPAANAIERYIDEQYDDHFISERFQNVEFRQPPHPEGDGIVRHVPARLGSAQGDSSTGESSDVG